MESARAITAKDDVIWELLADPLYKVTLEGQLLTRRPVRSEVAREWREAGWISPSRKGTKLYRRVEYRGIQLYVHRIVWAAFYRSLCPQFTVNHIDLNGLNNRPENLELISAANNLRHARAIYRRAGMSAAEAKASWISGRGPRNWRGTHGSQRLY